jgi:hypothetical protein
MQKQTKFKFIFFISLFAVLSGANCKADCITATIDSNQLGATIIVNCPTSVRLIGVPADNNQFYSDCIQQWYLPTDYTWTWNPLPVCGGWHGGANQTFWFFMPMSQAYDCHDLTSCEESASYGYVLLQRSNGVWSFIPTGPTLTITSPANNSTITSNTTTITGNYAALNSGLLGYGYLHIWLYNTNTQEHSETKTLLITGSAGDFNFPASVFAVTENGNWVLKANQEWDANTFVDLTPDPTITFDFNISGNATAYNFTDWTTWYTANAAGGYTTPSDWATSLTNFIQPIFTNAYEFANRTLKYFNADTAYAKGNQIGIIFPTTQAYINKINIFFGGFPLIQFFEFTVVVMLGVFIVRTIFKFIPFFG